MKVVKSYCSLIFQRFVVPFPIFIKTDKGNYCKRRTMINASEIACLRLQNQQIRQSRFQKPGELVSYMGAMQAQNYGMAKWAIGLRTNSTKNTVDKAIDDGTLIRTHLLRPTWHLAAAEDLPWMLALTAPRILSSVKSRHRELGLTKEELKKGFNIIENALLNNLHKTRNELVYALNKAGIETTQNNRAAHILMAAELNGLIASGRDAGKKSTYALLKERVYGTKKLGHEEAVSLLAKKYFNSHGPATAEDFSWWSGLTLKDARNGIEVISADLDSACLDSRQACLNSKTYWFPKTNGKEAFLPESAFLLPAFDEFVVSYKDRSAIFNTKDTGKAISSNGIFWPVIVMNGMVSGLWKQVIKKNEIVIETTLFRRHNKNEKALIRDAAFRLGLFLNIKAKISIFIA